MTTRSFLPALAFLVVFSVSATARPRFAPEPAFRDDFSPGWEKSQRDWRVATWNQNDTAMSPERCRTDAEGRLVQTVLPGLPHRGGSLQTGREFGYGRWIARVKPSSVPGVLNSIFTVDWDDLRTPAPDDGDKSEVDIEFLTHTFGPGKGSVHFAVHLRIDGKSVSQGWDIPLDFNPSDDFHEWGFDILPDGVVWHVDGRELHRWQASPGRAITPACEFFFNSWTGSSGDMGHWIKGPPAQAADYHIDWVKFHPLETFALSPASPPDLSVRVGMETLRFDPPELHTFSAFTKDAQPLPDAPAAPLTPAVPTDTHVGVSPVMTFAELAFEYYKDGANIRLALLPRVVLWNPYNRPLAPARYELGFGAISAGFKLQSRTPTAPPAPATAWIDEETRNLHWAGGTAAIPGVAQAFLRFIVDVQNPIPAGESHVFVLPATPQAYAAPYGSAPTNILNRNDFLPGHVYIDTGIVADPAKEFQTISTGGYSMSSYLGLDPADSDYSETSPNGHNWPGNNRRWHQSVMQSGNWAANAAIFQTTIDDETNVGSLVWGIQSRAFADAAGRYFAVNNPRAHVSAHVFDGYRGYSFRSGTAISTDFDPDANNRQASAAAVIASGVAPIGLNAVSGRAVDSVLFEFRPDDRPLISLGQLQHAGLSRRTDTPAYAIGNSLAPYIHLNPNKTDRNRLYRAPATSSPAVRVYLQGIHDVSYLLNRALWDRFFVSTVPHPGTGPSGTTSATPIPATLANPRHVRLPEATDADLRDADKAAARLLLKGGFNINSTSEQAWRAVLGGLNRLAHEAAGTPDSPLDSAFPRFAAPPAAIAPVSARPDWAFTGYRRLTEAQISALAAGIVAEIRARGPFVSLADFVNRRLRDNPATTHAVRNADETLQGALQNAIDLTPETGADSINNARGFAPFDTAASSVYFGGELDEHAMRGGPAWRAPSGSASAFAPQFLTQADILSVIGPGLSARSDTFVVRAYGDVKNPVTDEITARAWCEAVVQRTVEPVSPASANAHEPAAKNDFGRRFQIVAFRWLTSADI